MQKVNTNYYTTTCTHVYDIRVAQSNLSIQYRCYTVLFDQIMIRKDYRKYNKVERLAYTPENIKKCRLEKQTFLMRL